jgi:hypothetical protein
MRRSLVSVAVLLAVPGAVQAQASAWGFFEAGSGAGVGVQSADGSQLMFKCDKPGTGSVYAVLARKAPLVPPSTSPMMRSVRVRMDARPPYEDQWRVLENTAMAVNKGNERSLTHLLGAMNDASSVEVLLYADLKSRSPETFKFAIAGAKEALDQVYTSCKDKPPTA